MRNLIPNIPAEIDFGPKTYAVELVQELESSEHVRLNGNHLADWSKMRLDADLEEQHVYVVLWHEIIHAILTPPELNDENKIDELLLEAMVSAIAYGIVEVLDRNPDLVQYRGRRG